MIGKDFEYAETQEEHRELGIEAASNLIELLYLGANEQVGVWEAEAAADPADEEAALLLVEKKAQRDMFGAALALCRQVMDTYTIKEDDASASRNPN